MLICMVACCYLHVYIVYQYYNITGDCINIDIQLGPTVTPTHRSMGNEQGRMLSPEELRAREISQMDSEVKKKLSGGGIKYNSK